MQRAIIAMFAAAVMWSGCAEQYAPTSSPKAKPQSDQPAVTEQTAPAAGQTAQAPVEPRPMEPSEPFVPADVPESNPAEQPPAEPQSPPEEQPQTEQPPTEQPPAEPSPSPAPPTTPPARHSIELDLGVALPQTGPEGTMMMFSVEYEFVVGGSDPKAKYVWVIERTKGAAAKLTFPLSAKGKLDTAIFHWRPEEGPFRSHIEDAKGNRLSASIEMQ